MYPVPRRFVSPRVITLPASITMWCWHTTQSKGLVTLVTGERSLQWQLECCVVGDSITPGAQSITAGRVSLHAMSAKQPALKDDKTYIQDYDGTSTHLLLTVTPKPKN